MGCFRSSQIFNVNLEILSKPPITLQKKASYYIYLAWIIENLQLQEVLIKIKP